MPNEKHRMPWLRILLLTVSVCWTAFYFAFRGRKDWMNFVFQNVTRPWHRGAGAFYSHVPFSVGELLIVLGCLAALGFLVRLVIHFRKKHSIRRFVLWLLTLLTVLSCLFGLFCLWWGVAYYSDSFQDRSGLKARPISSEELGVVTEYFVAKANEYSSQVARNSDGIYTVSKQSVFDRSPYIYSGAEKLFPCLEGPALRAKPFQMSKILSLLNTTGFFFAFTAEANLNVDCPVCMLPSTVAHELAHQRGVAAEDEANFCAVLASMESGDADFIYSGAIMAYIYLGNALHDADYDRWEKVYHSLNEDVRRDLNDHNTYWDKFETPVKEASKTIYEGFLRTYGDNRGLRSYDACVDLLTVYYLDTAENAG